MAQSFIKLFCLPRTAWVWVAGKAISNLDFGQFSLLQRRSHLDDVEKQMYTYVCRQAVYLVCSRKWVGWGAE